MSFKEKISLILAITLSLITFSVSSEVTDKEISSLLKSAQEFKEKKQFDKEVEAYKKVLELDPKNAEIYVLLGNAYYYEMSKLQDAMQAYSKATFLDPKNMEAHIGIGRYFEIINQFKAAYDEYKKASEINPQCPLPHKRMGFVLNDMQKYDEAVNALKKAIELDPKDPDIHLMLSSIYASQSSDKEAEKEMEIYRSLKGTQ